MIWHYDKRMQLVLIFSAIVLQRFNEQFGVCRNLK